MIITEDGYSKYCESDKKIDPRIDTTVKYCKHCKKKHIVYACDKFIDFIKRKFNIK